MVKHDRVFLFHSVFHPDSSVSGSMADEHCRLSEIAKGVGFPISRESRKDYLLRFRFSDIREIKKAVAVQISDGSTVTIDYAIKTDGPDYHLIFPHSVDMKYTKEEIDRKYEALDIINRRYYAHTTVFSFTRFSDWCVEEAAHNEWFHIVPLERLKY